MSLLINPYTLYLACALGAVGLCMALPRRGVSPQVIGALVGAAGLGLVLLLLGARAVREGEGLPNLWFYVFGLILLGSALRVVTHKNAVYAALYFILTILATAGLFLILSAEFMAFALIIVYAGAILITYLFVLMLATQAPKEGEESSVPEYDAAAREPAAAAAIGFVLLAALTTMMFRGVPQLPAPAGVQRVVIAELPGRIETILRESGQMKAGEEVDRSNLRRRFAAGVIHIKGAEGERRLLEKKDWPANLRATNVEGVAFALLRDYPGLIEIAGVLLLMAMLGAVVLSRKQVQIDEEAKAHEVRRLGAGMGAGLSAGRAGSEGAA